MAIAALVSSGSIQQSANQLYQSGIYKEDVEGKLEEAIALYQEIIAKFPQEGPVAAKAWFHMGLCYEKLGNQKAQKAYQQVLSNYADQKEIASQARARLVALSKDNGEAARKPTFKQIRVPSALPFGAQLSPDGSKLAFATTEELLLLPIKGNISPDVAGVPEKLTVSLPEGVGIDRDGLAWSADGKWIVFNDFIQNKKGPYVSNIYVVSSEGGFPRKVSASPERGELSYNYRLGISPTGKQVAFTSLENGELHIETIPVQGSRARRLTEPPSTEPAYSPDGRLIAYVSRRMYATAGEKDRFEHPPGGVWVVPADGGAPVLVADVNSQAHYPIWSPDGKMIAFTDDNAIWVVPVSPDGKPAAKPRRFDPPRRFSSVLAGWTSDNKIGLVLRSPSYEAIYTIPASGGYASQVTPPGLRSSPKWSPDGKRIFFRNTGGQISSVPTEGGEIFDLPVRSDVKILEPMVGGENEISPDGRTIVFAGVKDGAPGIHLWTIPVAGGEPKQLTSDRSETIENRFPCWSSDGMWIAFVRGERLKGDIQYYANVNIYRIPAEGGEPTPLTTASDRVAFRDIAWSPDGKSLAYISAEDNLTIKVKSLETGASRVVGKAERPGWNSLSWSPDGKKLAFTPASYVKAPFSPIRIISLEDGTIVTLKTGLGEADYWHVSWSPDGKRLAFLAIQGGEPELWLMSDFLHLVKTSR